MIGGIMIGSGIFYLGTRTGLMSRGYVDDADNHGLEWISTEDMDRCCQLAKEHNLQVITNCIGDEAVRRTVDCYERAFVDGKNKLRHAVVHCQITDSGLLDRIARDDVLVFAQPIFLDYDMNIVEKLCGKELASTPTPSAPFCARACTCPTAPTAPWRFAIPSPTSTWPLPARIGTADPLTDSIPASAWTWRRLWMPTPWRVPMRSSRRTSRAA